MQLLEANYYSIHLNYSHSASWAKRCRYTVNVSQSLEAVRGEGRKINATLQELVKRRERVIWLRPTVTYKQTCNEYLFRGQGGKERSYIKIK